MARTPSQMVALGTTAPAFALPDTVSGETMTLESLRGNAATVIMFICNHCPFVQHVNAELVQLARTYGSRGVSFIAISANDAGQYPEDAPDRMKEAALALGYPFPYLYDETQETARAFQAACTPDFFVYDRSLKLAYRGQLDDSRPGNDIPVTGADIRKALDCLVQGVPVSPDQKPGIGCNIKWKSAT